MSACSSSEMILARKATQTKNTSISAQNARDADINRVLRVILREETAEIRKIAKALR